MKIFGPRNTKQSPVGGAVMVTHQYAAPPFAVDRYIREGYKQNVIINRCIREITQAIATVDIEVHQEKNVLEEHPVYDLLRKPNPSESGSQLLRRIFTDYLINGNIFLIQSPDQGKPTEIWAMDYRHVKIEPGKFGLPQKYIYDNRKEFPVDRVTGLSQVFHYKNYDPENPWVGMSPMQAAALSADAHNQGLKWNYSLLKNGARPSGIIKFKTQPGPDVIAFMTEYFKKRFQGSDNAGDVPVLPNDADFIELENTPKDMDFISTLKESAKYIASVYGVPLPLVDNDASTFNNMEQAKERFWTDTVLPLLNDFLSSYGAWLNMRFGYKGAEAITLVVNMDSIPALEGARERRFRRMGQAVRDGLISPDEGREAVDYKPRGGLAGDLFVPSSAIPIDMAGEVMQSDNTPDINEDDLGEEAKSLFRILKSMNYSKTEIRTILEEEFATTKH